MGGLFMNTLRFDLSKDGNKFKILNATNGGPWHKRHANDQGRSNFSDYKAARIPYSRNHDSCLEMSYGGPYSHDISAIFPNFDADVNDPNSYDFACTDESILICKEAGTETFFRLGQTIEHQIVKHHVFPPKDFKKWAEICEHIIRHYNEGWANGYELDIKYWEIWNEPDLDIYQDYKRTWTGTSEEFFDLYETAAKHLKEKFPHLKIGGPASCGREDWIEEFIKEMAKRKAPLDFLSWHIYCSEPEWIAVRGDKVKKWLMENGFEKTENHCNEWNYIKGWTGDDFIYSIKSMHGIKGAAFVSAAIALAQASTIDMLMYYDTRPSVFCGAFDLYTYEKLKGYYPLCWYGKFYDMEKEIPSENKLDNLYSLCGVDKEGKVMSMVTYYSDDDSSGNKQVCLDFGKTGKYEAYLVDEDHDGELICTTEELEFDLKRNSILLIKEI